MLLLALQQTAAACRYTVRDVAMVDLNEKPYVACLVAETPLSPAQVESLSAAAHLLDDSNIVFRTLSSSSKSTDEIESNILSALQPLGITSYPAMVILAPDGRTLSLPVADRELLSDDNSIDIAAMRQLLEPLITSPPREKMLKYLLLGHSVILVVEGNDNANNQRAISWAKAAVVRVKDALPTMAKPIELPPRMILFSQEQAASERVLFWSLGIDFSEKSAAQIVLLFGRGRKLGPVLRVPGSQQEDLWRSLEVVGSDCECGLDRSWMQGPMIPHQWSTAEETDAAATLGFDPGSPLVKAEISRILARGPLDFKQAKQSLQQPLAAQLQLDEIDIEALVSEQLADSQPKQKIAPAASQPIKTAAADLSRVRENPPKGTSTPQKTFTWVIVALLLVAGFGSLGILLGRKKQV